MSTRLAVIGDPVDDRDVWPPLGEGGRHLEPLRREGGVTPLGPGGLTSPLGQPDPLLVQQGMNLLMNAPSKTSNVSDGAGQIDLR